MISVVTVFNDLDVLDNRLLRSLEAQSAEYQLVKVDNRAQSFSSAAAALNYGATNATGDYILFAHQDISLLDSDWLRKAERALVRADLRGWAGVAGVAESGEYRGFLVDRESLFGLPFDGVREVQTLDECVLIHRRTDDAQYFDEDLAGWHAYGVDACCTALRNGRKNIVLSLRTWHDSKTANLQGLEFWHRFVWEKHMSAFESIATTCGILPTEYQRAGPKTRFKIPVSLRDGLARTLRTRGSFGSGIEDLTRQFHHVECLHEQQREPELPVTSFVPVPDEKRTVNHHFKGLEFSSGGECIVLFPDMSAEVLEKPERLFEVAESGSVTFVCIYLESALRRPNSLFRIWRRASVVHPAFVDEIRRSILVMRLRPTDPVMASITEARRI